MCLCTQVATILQLFEDVAANNVGVVPIIATIYSFGYDYLSAIVVAVIVEVIVCTKYCDSTSNSNSDTYRAIGL